MENNNLFDLEVTDYAANEIRGYEKEKICGLKALLETSRSFQKSLKKIRRELAKYRGYIFENDTESKKNNDLRLEGLLRDYAFYQFFSLYCDETNSYTNFNEEKEMEKIRLDENWKAEWREGFKC